jgi:hypothetical protein
MTPLHGRLIPKRLKDRTPVHIVEEGLLHPPVRGPASLESPSGHPYVLHQERYDRLPVLPRYAIEEHL